MNIAYASNDNFAEMLGISMISLFENNTGCEDISIYVLDDGISEENKSLLMRITDEYDRKIYFFNVKHLLDDDMKQQRGSLSTFSRLYLNKLLPSEIEKILYLDCDILVLKNLEDLYGFDIDNYYCAGVNDCVSRSHLKAIGLNSGSNYFNAGVLLINLKMWREDNVTEKFEEFARKYNNDVPYADQGIINGILSSRSMRLSLKYNCYTAVYDFTYKDLMTFRKPQKYYSELETETSKNDPSIVHFTTSFLSLRPWIEGCKHPFADEWLRYKTMSVWADAPMRKDERSAPKKLAVMIYRALPNSVSVNIAGMLHAKIVPAITSRKNI